MIPTVLAYQEPEVIEQEQDAVWGLGFEQSTTTEDIIDIYSKMYGVNPSLARAIMRCEGGITKDGQYNLMAKNPHSSASGAFQFIDSTWKSTMKRMGLPLETSKTDPVISIRAGIWLLSQDGTRHWNESKYCWSK